MKHDLRLPGSLGILGTIIILMGIRKIVPIDMDAIDASGEQHDNPELRGKPVTGK
jgi:hypothetical protein